jgi:putative NADPH-quinone reductase
MLSHMPKRILIIDGHPDGEGRRFVHALAETYATGAREAGHSVQTITVGALAIPPLRRNEDFQTGKPPAVVREWQRKIAWCNHLVVLYPLWLGDMPAVLKAFFEQVMRPGFAFKEGGAGRFPVPQLQHRSARVVVTMGMPALFYRWYFRAHTLKSLKRNILEFAGLGPVQSTVIGGVESSARDRAKWLARLQALGRAGR